MKRPLGSFESAQVLTNEHFPFNVVTVLGLDPGPDPVVLRRALAILRDRHPLLRARVVPANRSFEFHLDEDLSIPLTVVSNAAAGAWRNVAEEELNTGFDAATGPLLRMTALLSADGQVRFLIICAQHVVFDAVSGTHLLSEILTLCRLLAAKETLDGFAPLPLNLAAEAYFPAAYRGWRGLARRVPLLARQLADEFTYRWKTRGLREPSIAAGARCRIHTARLSESQTQALARRCRRERVTPNSALCAAQLKAAQERLPGLSLLRHFVFADLRPYLEPSLAPEHLGSYFAMLRLSTEVQGGDFWALARRLNLQIHAASKRGDKFTSVPLSRALMAMVLRTGRLRMGHAALAYGGGARLAERYGDIRVTGLNAFVSNFVLGPPYTANARRFLGRLWWDMVYLDSDMDTITARAVADRLITLLSA